MLDKSVSYNQGAVGTSIGKLAIGHFNSESSRGSRTDRMFRGLIDQIAVYNSILKLSNIQTVQNIGGTTSVRDNFATESEMSGINSEFGFNLYPNPFNPSTTLSYQLPSACNISLEVYDMLGREIVTLANGVKQAGTYTATFNASHLSSGMYFARFTATPQDGSKAYMKVQKMLLAK